MVQYDILVEKRTDLILAQQMNLNQRRMNSFFLKPLFYLFQIFNFFLHFSFFAITFIFPSRYTYQFNHKWIFFISALLPIQKNQKRLIQFQLPQQKELLEDEELSDTDSTTSSIDFGDQIIDLFQEPPFISSPQPNQIKANINQAIDPKLFLDKLQDLFDVYKKEFLSPETTGERKKELLVLLKEIKNGAFNLSKMVLNNVNLYKTCLTFYKTALTFYLCANPPIIETFFGKHRRITKKECDYFNQLILFSRGK